MERKLKCETGEMYCFTCHGKDTCTNFSEITGESVCYKCGRLFIKTERKINFDFLESLTKDEVSNILFDIEPDDLCDDCLQEAKRIAFHEICDSTKSRLDSTWIERCNSIKLYDILGIDETNRYFKYLHESELGFDLLMDYTVRMIETMTCEDLNLFSESTGQAERELLAVVGSHMLNDIYSLTYCGQEDKESAKKIQRDLLDVLCDFFKDISAIPTGELNSNIDEKHLCLARKCIAYTKYCTKFKELMHKYNI